MTVKRVSIILAILIPLIGFAVYKYGYKRYQTQFYDVFDTDTIVCGYARSERQFQDYAGIIYQEMLRLHELYDIYNSYDGVNNLKTVNDSAGVSAVKVDSSIIELLLLAKLAYSESNGTVNAAMGSVLSVWHDYRERGTSLPPMGELENAARHTDIDNLVIDEAASTVFLKDPQMRLDVGALAKGFAVEKAMIAAKKAGFKSGFISAGGNVRTSGSPLDGREAWSVGIQAPGFMPDGSQPLYDTVLVSDMAAVSSGDYQRFYVVDGQIYHHIIDPETLMPAARFSAVTIIHPDSGIADMLSTALYIMPYEQGLALLQKYNADAIWIFNDNTSRETDGYKVVSKFAQTKPAP